MGTYANLNFGQAKPTEMATRRFVTEGSVPADFGKNRFEAFALGPLRGSDRGDQPALTPSWSNRFIRIALQRDSERM